jgi:outer membrane receptor protein involved in Fe transport
VALVLALGVVGVSHAQGVQTATLRGTVTSAEGDALPGVLVTATSSAIQGERTAFSGASGDYIIRGLNPGLYAVTFALEGMAPVQRNADLQLGQVANLDVQLSMEVIAETIVVTGDLPTVLQSSEVSTTYDFETVNSLPIGTTPAAIATLAPGLTTNTPNAGQVTISGGFAYDNVFLIDGVDANDNLFGTPTAVFIEDAIADTQVLTSGISAEYGRFSGGVVNVITKSGGNEFSGTLRASLTNDDWRETTPREDRLGTQLQDQLNEVYSGTLGGYVLKDRLWFFVAGRLQETSTTGSMVFTGLPRTTTTDQDRQEFKLTGNIADRHQLQAQYTEFNQDQFRVSSSAGSATPQTQTTWSTPSELIVARYSGVLTSSLFGELQYSEKSFLFQTNLEMAGRNDLARDSPFWDDFGDIGVHYHAPHWDVTDPEDRNNEQISTALSYFLDTAAIGSHDLKVGYEDFNTYRTGGNSQSPTDFQFIANPLLDANGDAVLTPDQDMIPVWETANSGAWQFFPNRNARVDITTRSFYVNDRWQLNDHWSFNLGARYEDVQGESDAGTVTVDTDALVPRLGASFDLRGDGKYRFDATYAEYAGKYSESQFAENTDVGNPPALLLLYIGPEGQGYDFGPAFDIANNYIPIAADDGTQNVFVDSNISSPTVEEITLAGGMELGRGGYLKAVFTDREYSDFVEDFITTETGTTEVIVEGTSAGEFSNIFISNSSFASREYQSIQLIGRYRITDNWLVEGNYTNQLKNEGNFEGEGANTPGSPSPIGDYPEIRSTAQHFPVGNLDDYAEHKLRLWTTYNLDFGRAGDLGVGFLANYDSGRVFSATWTTAGFTATQLGILDDLGYVDTPSSQTLYFGERGTVEFDDAMTFDLSLNYAVPIFGDFDVWVKADVFNILNDDTQIAGSTAVIGNTGTRPVECGGVCPTDELGLPTTYRPASSFGNDRGNADFVAPREYRFTVGFRF